MKQVASTGGGIYTLCFFLKSSSIAPGIKFLTYHNYPAVSFMLGAIKRSIIGCAGYLRHPVLATWLIRLGAN
jgi:hypothetical protein